MLKELDTNTTVLTNAVSQSWNMGTGRFLSDPEVTNGTSWIWRNESGSVPWLTVSYGGVLQDFKTPWGSGS
jgi:hypothetical protein